MGVSMIRAAVFSVAIFFQMSVVLALTPAFPIPATGLFSNTEVLEVKLEAPFSSLLKAKELGVIEAKKLSLDGTLSYKTEMGWFSSAVKVSLKGFTSLGFCSFPKLELKLAKNLPADSLFYGMKSVDLNTHCVEDVDSVVYGSALYKTALKNHREAFIYRMLNIFDIPSYLSRPAMVSYKDSDPQPDSKFTVKQDHSYQAFFLEDYGQFRRRLDLKAIRGLRDQLKSFDDPTDIEKAQSYQFDYVLATSRIDVQDVARMALFQYLIGNSDWFIQLTKDEGRFGLAPTSDQLWNIKVVETKDDKWVVIPHDFNFSMMMLDHTNVANPKSLFIQKNLELVSHEVLRDLFEQMKSKMPIIEAELDRWPTIEKQIVLARLNAAFNLFQHP